LEKSGARELNFMTTITLRAYNRDIESMINNAHFDEAIAHCRHILKIFPKHIDTYRLLGQAYLEAQRFNDADDIFKRILSSIPDDFVPHLGLSIIREKQDNLNAAIWHMERAYDVQPANTSVQKELRRLYSLRDEFEPVKIHLTRGALARMYLKGDLYPQAIAEIRAALSEDAERPDLQILLARAYILSEKKAEAVETCSTLIQKLPYCLDANRILAEVLPETENADEAITYRERVHALDPYSAHFSTQIKSPEEIDDSAILLEKHEYIPEEPDLSITEQSEWGQTFEVDSEALVISDEAFPDWLIKPLNEEAVDLQEEESEFLENSESLEAEINKKEPIIIDDLDQDHPKENETQPEDLIPDWMKSSGWEPASKTEGISPPALEDLEEDLPPAEETADADMPDWLRDTSLVSSESGESEEEGVPWLEEPPPSDSDTISDWLKESKSTSETGRLIDPSLSEEADLPDWLEGLEGEEDSAEVDEGVYIDKEKTEPLEIFSQPDKLEEEQTEMAEEPEAKYEEDEVEKEFKIPEWLRAEDISRIEDTEIDIETSEVPAEITSEQPPVVSEVEDEMLSAGTADQYDSEDEVEGEVEEEELHKPAEFEAEGEVTTPGEEVPGVTDWLRTLEEVQEEVSAEEQLTPHEDIVEDEEQVEYAEEKPSEHFPGVTGWLKTLEASAEEEGLVEEEKESQEPVEGEPLSEDFETPVEAIVEGMDQEIEPDDQVPGVTGWLETLDEVDEEEELELDKEYESLGEAQTIDENHPSIEDTLIEDEDQVEEPEKRIPGVTDWLRTLKEIEEESGVEEPKLVDKSEMEMPPQPGDDEDAAGLVASEKISPEEKISKEEAETAEFEETEVPEWLQDLEIELSDEHDIDIIPGEIPDWLQAAAQEEGEETEFDWSIFSEEDSLTEEIDEIKPEQVEGVGISDQIIEPPPILGDTQPIRRKVEEMEEPESPPQVAEEEITHEIDEGERDQVEAAQLTGAEEEDAAMAWLESLATREGLLEDEQAVEEATIEEPQDVTKAAADEVESTEIEPEPQAEEISEWLVEEIKSDIEEPGIPDETDIIPKSVAEMEDEGPAGKETEEESALEQIEEIEATPADVEEETVVLEAEGEEPAFEQIEEIEATPADVEEETVVLEAEGEEPAFEQIEEIEATPADVEEETVVLEAEGEEPAFEQIEEIEATPADVEEETVVLEAEGEEPAFEQIEEIEATPADVEEETVVLEAEGEEPAFEQVKDTETVVDELEEELVPEQIEHIEPETVAEAVVDLNTASLSQLERIPGIGFIVAQSIINYRETQGTFEAVEELTNISEIDDAMLEEIKPWLTLTPEVEKPTEELLKEPELLDAWRSIESGDVSSALERYHQLITKQRFLDRVIHDLNEAIHLFPSDVTLYEALGDAYVRNDNLQEALDAYLKAEDIIK
jgi:competence ComEA-like helix-hairpin-helix protein